MMNEKTEYTNQTQVTYRNVGGTFGKKHAEIINVFVVLPANQICRGEPLQVGSKRSIQKRQTR